MSWIYAIDSFLNLIIIAPIKYGNHDVEITKLSFLQEVQWKC